MDGRVLDEDAVATLRRLGPDAPVMAMPISSRLKSAVLRLGAEAVSDIAKLSVGELAGCPGVGPKFLAEIREALAVHGLHLRADEGQGSDDEGQGSDDRAQLERRTEPRIDDNDPLRAELLGLLRFASESERLGLARVLGWDGLGGASVRRVAQELGISPEALAAARARLRDSLARDAPATPVLDDALRLLEAAWPATTATAGAALHSQRLSNGAFDPAGMLHAAKLLGRRTGLIIERARVPILTTRGFTDVAEAVAIACTLSLAGRAAATVNDVLAHLAGEHDPSRWRLLVAALVDADDGLEWLDPRRRSFGRYGLAREALGVLASAVEREGECSTGRALELLADAPAIGPGIGRRLLVVICARADAFEIDGDRLRPRPLTEPETFEEPSLARFDIETVDVEATARHAALVQVLRTRPETSLAELFAMEGDVGAWLRSSTIVDVARAALEAGVDGSTPRGVADRARVPDRSPTMAWSREPARELLPDAVSEPPSDSTEKVDCLQPVVTMVAQPSPTSSTWSTSASSLSLAVPTLPSDEISTQPQPPPVRAPAQDDEESSELVGQADVLAVFQAASSKGLTLGEVEAALRCSRSRVRRIVLQLEASKIVRRTGAARSTRYSLATSTEIHDDGPRASPAEDVSTRAFPIRRRRVDVEGVRTLYYRPHADSDPQKVAAIVLRDHAITIEYAAGQRPFDALERIVTPDGVVTPRDGLRFWTALERAFSTSSHFFVSQDPDVA